MEGHNKAGAMETREWDTVSGTRVYGDAAAATLRRDARVATLLDMDDPRFSRAAFEEQQSRHKTLREDQILVFDARMLHRGGANTGQTHRRVLIVRYDRPRTPPPGVGIIGTVTDQRHWSSWKSL